LEDGVTPVDMAVAADSVRPYGSERTGLEWPESNEAAEKLVQQAEEVGYIFEECTDQNVIGLRGTEITPHQRVNVYPTAGGAIGKVEVEGLTEEDIPYTTTFESAEGPIMYLDEVLGDDGETLLDLIAPEEEAPERDTVY
jgi:hypothetical protein